MPTYEYQCTKCGAITEVFQPITETPRRKLRNSDRPRCDCRATVVRLLGSGAGIIFKGSGFYSTDYRSESYKKAAEAEKGGVSEKASKEGASKPSKDGEGAESKKNGAEKSGSSSKSETKSDK